MSDKKDFTSHVEQIPESLSNVQKIDTVDQDVALQIFQDPRAIADDIDPIAEERLVRKIDLYIIPFIGITYLVTYIDKATLGYAALFGMQKDLGLVGTQYSWLSSIFYFGYMVFEYPTSFGMQKYSVSKWLSANIIIWGGICMALGGGNDFKTEAALRFILGMLESCSTPAFLLLTSMWYTIDEQPIRIGWWSMFLGLSNAFGGLLAYGIGHIHGSLTTWRYQFIIVGAVSSVWGILMYFFLAENPTTARWLSADEKRMAVERLRDNHTGIKNTHFKKAQVVEALLDPKTWILFLFGLSTQVVNGSISNFGSLIIKGFGYTSLTTTLLQIPYGFIILFSVSSSMYLQKWLPGQQRCTVGILYVLPALAGVAGIHALPVANKHGRLACYYLTAFYTASFAMCVGLLTANIAGSTKRTTVNALFFISYCAGNIIGPFAFKSLEAPVYSSGIIAVMICYVVEILVLGLFALHLRRANNIKQRKAIELGYNETSAEERAMSGFKDLTDLENPFFRYSY